MEFWLAALLPVKVPYISLLCEILNSVAQSIGVHNPTEEETEKFRKQLSCKIEIESMDNDYMQCAAGTGHIFINGSVHS